MKQDQGGVYPFPKNFLTRDFSGHAHKREGGVYPQGMQLCVSNMSQITPEGEAEAGGGGGAAGVHFLLLIPVRPLHEYAADPAAARPYRGKYSRKIYGTL